MSNTVFIRAEGALQSWGSGSHFVYRSTNMEPTKSGITGLVAACMGIRYEESDRLKTLAQLRMGVREDRPGSIMDDYHTYGGVGGSLSAGGKEKKNAKSHLPETGETIRSYLCDASFLVALAGNDNIIDSVVLALKNPIFTPYLGRRCCSPSRPLLEAVGDFPDLKVALASRPWRPRSTEQPPLRLRCVIEKEALSYIDEVRQDVLLSTLPLVHGSRVVETVYVTPPIGERTNPVFCRLSPIYHSGRLSEAKKAERLAIDNYLCVVCQLPARDVHHVTYEREGDELMEDLRSVCRICHDVMTDIEYSRDMGMHRIDPLDPEWHDFILKTRDRRGF